MASETDLNQNQPVAVGIDGQPVKSPLEKAVDKPVVSTSDGSTSWGKILNRARNRATLAVLGLIVIVIAGGGAFFWFSSRSHPQTSSSKLSTDLNNLPTSSLGHDGESLTIGAATTFKNKVVVNGDVDVTGKLNTDTPLNVTSLQVAGATSLSAADVKSNLNVAGTSALQGNVTVANLLTVAGNLNVTGNSSFGGTLTGGNLSVKNETVGGSLTLGGHVISTGATPGISAGSAVGGAGTVSISGNDRAGTITINTGATPPAGILANVVFRNSYGTAPHVLVTPLGSNTGALQYYVTKTSNGFSVATLNAPAAGAGYGFDYLIEQ